MKKAIYLIVLSFMYFSALSQPDIGLINDFEDGTTQGWTEGGGSPNKPSNQASGGPAGADDNFLRNISSGSGTSGSKWIMFNTGSDWTGNWTAAGVTEVTMDVRNMGDNDVTIRFALGTNNSQSSNNGIFSAGVNIPADGQWTNISIPVTASDFIGGANAASTLSNVGAFRILLNNSGSWTGQTISATVDVDNITTVGGEMVEELVISCSKENDVSENGGSDGEATVNISGGTPPYSIAINVDGGVTNIVAQVGDNTLSDLSAGDYEIVVTDADATMDNCAFTILEPSPPISLVCSVDADASEAGAEDGGATIEISGGTPPFVVTVVLNGNETVFEEVMDELVLENLAAGDYTINVVDAADLLEVCDFTISEPTAAFSITCTVISDATANGVSDGMATIEITGGAEPFSISVVNEGDTSTFGSGRLTELPTLGAGEYIVLVTDNDGEVAECAFLIEEPPPSSLPYQAILVAKNQPALPPSQGLGTIQATLAGDTLTVWGTFSALTSTATAAHIHIGLQGESGPVSIPLLFTLGEDSTSGEFVADSNIYILDTDQLNNLDSRRMYINIHTVNNPGGEIRGQITPEVDAVYSANLFGSYVVPCVMTQASGSILIELDGNDVTVSGSFSGLEGNWTNAHIHKGIAGMNGGVEVPLAVTVGADMRSGVLEAADNIATLTAGQVDDLVNRRHYVNIHSEKAPSGEIRGQVVGGMSRNVFRAAILGSNELPRVMTQASGMVIAEVINDTTFHVSGSFNGLESNFSASHLHNGMPGMNREVLFALNPTATDTVSGVFGYANNQFSGMTNDVLRLYNRGIYVNVHTENNPGGEIRGQLVPESQIIFNAYLSSIFSGPNVRSQALGDVIATLKGNTLQMNGFFSGLTGKVATEIAGGAHIHMAIGGSNGGIIFTLIPTLAEDSLSGRFRPQDNIFELDSTQIAALRQRKLYINIHSDHSTGGEIRGQFLQEAQIYFAAPLSGASATTPVRSMGSGMVLGELTGSNFFVSGSFADLSSNVNIAAAGGAHIHEGMAGMNGGIKFPLSITFDSDSTRGTFEVMGNAQSLTNGQIDTLRSRGYYVNIHSLEVGSGEIRGQVLPFANSYYTAYLSGRNQPQPNPTTGSGQVKLELNGSGLALSGSYAGLSTPINVAAAGGAHIHEGGVGENGGIVFSLAVTISEDSLSGAFLVDQNVNPVDSAQWLVLDSDRYYVNIHSKALGAGELRGQVLRETNQFPQASMIISPEDSSFVGVTADSSEVFTAVWSEAVDRDSVNYFWQLSLTPTFDTLTLVQGTGAMPQFQTIMATISGLLNLLGVAEGDTVAVYHRVMATDGSLWTLSDPATAFLVNGMITSVFDLNQDGISVHMYPNPTTDYLRFDFSQPLKEDTEILVISPDGKVFKNVNIGRSATQATVDLQTLAPNFYMVKIGNKTLPVLKM